jgi:hypothetical protein
MMALAGLFLYVVWEIACDSVRYVMVGAPICVVLYKVLDRVMPTPRSGLKPRPTLRSGLVKN